MLLMNNASTNITILSAMIPGGKEFLEDLMKELQNTHHEYSDCTVAEYEMFGTQIIYDKKWLDTKTVRNPYWNKEQIMKECDFIIDGKPNERLDDEINYMHQIWSSDGRTLEIWDTEKGDKLVIQIVFGIGDIPIKQQKYLLYLASKITSFPEDVTANDIDQIHILYKRFKKQYLAA